MRVGLHVEQIDEIGMLEVQTLFHTAQLDILLVLEQLERDLFPCVADGVVDLAKPATVNTGIDLSKAKMIVNNYQEPASDGELRPYEAVVYLL